jgi:YjbE family integral membrane protein
MSSAGFFATALQIVLIDLLLAGDNALVIAMAVRSLPPRERRIGTICGAGAAVLLRVGLTYVAARLLQIAYLQAVGGLLILWIAVKVLRDANDPPDCAPASQKLLQAIWYVVFADLTMSIDNILAIAGASDGHLGLILFGLGLSIPFVVFSSNLLASIMDRYPITIYIGAGILGKVAGDMIMQDRITVDVLHPSGLARYAVDAALIAGIILVGRRKKAKPRDAPAQPC